MTMDITERIMTEREKEKRLLKKMARCKINLEKANRELEEAMQERAFAKGRLKKIKKSKVWQGSKPLRRLAGKIGKP